MVTLFKFKYAHCSKPVGDSGRAGQAVQRQSGQLDTVNRQLESRMKQFRLTILVIFLAFTLSVTCESRGKKTHPGCIIWWFLPGCPLAKLFGPDPFNFYPWDKLCDKYTAFDDTKFCKNLPRELMSLDESMKGYYRESILTDEEAMLPRINDHNI